MKAKKLLIAVLVSLFLISSTSASEFEDSVARGDAVYSKNCVPCHGDKGQGGIGAQLADKDKLQALGMEEIKKVVKAGRAGKTPATSMPAWSGKLSEQEINGVVDFMFFKWGGLRPPVGIEMEPWEVGFVVFGGIFLIMGIYYVIRP